MPDGFQKFSRMTQAEEAKETVADGLNGLADCYEGIVKLVRRLDNCLNRNGG
jgi:hypothetical protein